jgi:chaperonin GroEL (HSP60 family)
LQYNKDKANVGLFVEQGTITNILEENVLQPLLVTYSMITLASETVAMILKIDGKWAGCFVAINIHQFFVSNGEF